MSSERRAASGLPFFVVQKRYRRFMPSMLRKKLASPNWAEAEEKLRAEGDMDDDDDDDDDFEEAEAADNMEE